MAAYLRPRETGEIKATLTDEIGEMVRSIAHVAEYYMSDPARAIEAQTALTTQFIDLWAATLRRFQGAPVKPVAEPDRADKRFSDAEWRDNPFFDFIKQAYVLTTRWADDLVRRDDELEPHELFPPQFEPALRRRYFAKPSPARRIVRPCAGAPYGAVIFSTTSRPRTMTKNAIARRGTAHRVDQLHDPINRLRLVAAEHILELA